MAGIYIHIPFCKQACHYCDFHFSTSTKKKTQLINAICDELALRKNELQLPIETIYFGGGTPSLLTIEELEQIFSTIDKCFTLSENPEITLEANPDDLNEAYLQQLSNSRVNRLSIGVQSFFEQDLLMMNRAHNVREAKESIAMVQAYFENFSIDLIYGIPEMSAERWLENITMALQFEVPHLSCYALTVEPKTALQRFIDKGLIPPVDDELAQEHHKMLVEVMEAQGLINYEFSNFGKPGFESRNNQAYWTGKPYLGIGPSAHSFDGSIRSWNVSNNSLYINSIERKSLPIERETLTKKDQYNEYVMTRLRLADGIQIEAVKDQFGVQVQEHLLAQSKSHIEQGRLILENGLLKVTKEGKFLSDGIASDLFLLNLS